MRGLRLVPCYRRQGVVPGGNGGGGTLPQPSNFGTDIRDWMKQSGDQVLTVADGTTLTGGIVDPAACAHAANVSGTYGGWLVIRPQTYLGATIDLSTTGLSWGAQGSPLGKVDYRILFVGFRVNNGLQQIWGGRNIRFWYCDFTFPISQWESQYEAAGGTAGVANLAVRDSMPNNLPSAFRIIGEISQGGPYPSGFGWWGCNFHNCGDDGLYVQGVSSSVIRGCQFWDINHHGTNPGGWFHNDCLQTEWGSNWTISDSYLGGHVQAEAHDSSLTNWAFSNCWSIGSPQWGITVDKMTHSVTNFTLDQIRWAANGQYVNASDAVTATPTYNANYDAALALLVNGATITQTNITHGLPSGVTTTGGLLDDLLGADYPNVPTITNHASNPANVWRATSGQAYADWPTYLAAVGWP